MRISLLHNPIAGRRDHHQKQLVARMESAGHRVALIGEDHIPAAENCDLIVAAGGDGTVGQAVRRFSHLGIPFAILPLGTANNIARSLGIDGAPETLIHGWPESVKEWERFRLALPEAKAGQGSRFFLESSGVGLLSRFAAVARLEQRVRQAADHDARGELRHKIGALWEVLFGMKADDYRLWVDGRDISGRYLLVEVMNIGRAGPALPLSPGKEPGDGLLDAVLVESDARGRLLDYLGALSQGRKPENDLPRIRGQRFRLQALARDIHVDDELLARSGSGEVMEIRLEGSAKYITIMK